ncbi:MAG: vWA domain-containing protein [Planctomycetota bacterium]|jgi:hypothetical protein
MRRPLVVLPLIFATACSSLEFKDAEIVSSEFDAAQGATKVTARFEVYDSDGQPMNGLSVASFRAREDGVLIPSESLASASSELHAVDLIVLIDDSRSMYEDGSIAQVKSAVNSLVEGLQGHPHQLHVMSFANEIQKLDSVAAISDEFDAGDTKKRWTALYFALQTAIEAHPKGVFVVFTNGADNYSHNHGINSLQELTSTIQEENIRLYAAAFGNIDAEYDRQGITGGSALAQLSMNGRMHRATEEDSLGPILNDIIGNIRATYTFTYYSPNMSGEHNLVINANHDKKKGRSPDLKWQSKK